VDAVLIVGGLMLVILLFILGLLAGIGMLDREKRKPPEEQLASRFARGQISEAEYLRSLAILQSGADLVDEVHSELPPPERSPG
jgi:uncharacterized membrane protein